MTVLGIDTATPAGSVGVSRDGGILTERCEIHRKGHCDSLPGMVAAALEEARVAVGQLDGIAVSIGPGSFTGLRVAVAFAKGLGFAGGTPLAGIGTLAAFAAAAEIPEDLVATCLDARKGEVYLAVFRRRGKALEELLGPRALSPAAAAAGIVGAFGGERGAVIGDGAERYPELASLRECGHALPSFAQVHPRAGVVALFGERVFRGGGGVSAAELSPFYARPSEAERRRERLH